VSPPANQHLLVLNALLRCTREDSKAAPLFEPVNHVPDLWVLELGPFADEAWPVWLAETQKMLAVNQRFLKSLAEGSRDYTLHLTVVRSELRALTIPPTLSQILGFCGITLEVFHSTTTA
jgi:hypothetical protein